MKTKKSFTFNKLYLFAFLIPAVIANLKSVSTFIFETPSILASCNISSGTPFAPGIFPPYSIPLATVLSCILICTISIFLFWWNSIIN